MQKMFKLRSCEDSVFRNRSRPCLQHQIGRCSAPCVGLVATRDYDASVRRAALFLEGRSDELVDDLTQAMEAASARLEFEQAAQLRDPIAGIRKVQARQYVEGEQVDMDVLACAMHAGRGLRAAALVPRRHEPGHARLLPKAQWRGYRRRKCWRRSSPSTTSSSARRARSCSAMTFRTSSCSRRCFPTRPDARCEIKSSVRGERARYLELARNNAEHALAGAGQQQRHAEQARCCRCRNCLQLADAAAAHRVLRHQPHDGRGHGGLLRGLRRRGTGARPVPALQHRRHRRRATTTPPCTRRSSVVSSARWRTASLPDLLLIDGGAGQLAQAQRGAGRTWRGRRDHGRRGQGRGAPRRVTRRWYSPTAARSGRASIRRACN